MINEFEKAIKNTQGFNGVILIAEDGDIVFNQAYGYANFEWLIENTIDTRFRIGSLTKQFTAMAILRLEEEGKLSIDAPICDYLHDCPEHWKKITIYHLLTHTSGIVNYTDFPDFLDVMGNNISSSGLIEKFSNKLLDFEVGTKWAYSNSGYYLLGEIIRNASALPYNTYLDQTFFQPLGMKNTGCDSNSAVITRRAYGYATEETYAPYINMIITGSAGNLYSTACDQLIWNQALHQGKVISKTTWDAMWKREVATNNPAWHYHGYGLFRTPMLGKELIIGNDGGIPGFLAFNEHLVHAKVDVIILTNLPAKVKNLNVDLRNAIIDENEL